MPLVEHEANQSAATKQSHTPPLGLKQKLISVFFKETKIPEMITISPSHQLSSQQLEFFSMSHLSSVVLNLGVV